MKFGLKFSNEFPHYSEYLVDSMLVYYIYEFIQLEIWKSGWNLTNHKDTSEWLRITTTNNYSWCPQELFIFKYLLLDFNSKIIRFPLSLFVPVSQSIELRKISKEQVVLFHNSQNLHSPQSYRWNIWPVKKSLTRDARFYSLDMISNKSTKFKLKNTC